MSLRDAIARFATGTYQVTRAARGTYVNGRYVPSGDAPTVFSIRASVQPVDGRTLESLAEGERESEVRQIFTTTALMTSSDDHEADQVDLDGDGDGWVVFRVERYAAFGAVHYRALVS